MDIRKPAFGTTIYEDWDAATSFLLEKGYFCETIVAENAKSTTTKGLVFAHPQRLKILTQRGYLTIFDSTHKMNLHNYNLFTFMCRDEHGIWVPGAHCLVENENSDILAEGMRRIYRWTGNKWKMQYPLTDNSSIEKSAVKKAFLEEGHVKTHLLCTVHSERTLSRNFRTEEDRESYEFLRHAMRCHSEEECISLCQQAINVATSDKKRNYIQKEWLETRQHWAMFARQHCQILLQVTSSNACEAWHGRLKNGAGLKKSETSSHGIYGCVRYVRLCSILKI